MTNQKESRVHLRGFGSMNPERQKMLASKGGKNGHIKGTAHEFTSEEARKAGKIGGKAKALKSKQSKEAIN